MMFVSEQFNDTVQDDVAVDNMVTYDYKAKYIGGKVMDLINIKECEFCGEPIQESENVYQVMIYDKSGNQKFLKVCSYICADDAKLKSYNIHQNMADDVENGSIQQLR